MKLSFFILSLFLLGRTLTMAQIDTADDRGGETRAVGKNDSTYNAFYKESYALIIAIGDYRKKGDQLSDMGWPSLTGPYHDAGLVKKNLGKQGFKVEVLTDPGTFSELKDSLFNFLKKASGNKDNRIIIYYAGHGFSDKDDAYLVMPEMVKESNSNLHSVEFLFEMLNRFDIPKHVLVIMDACYMGKASQYILNNEESEIPPIIQAYLKEKGRYLLTASTRDQSVPDVSIFCDYFVKGINGEADLVKDGYVTLSELKVYLQSLVANDSKGMQIIFLGQILNTEQKKNLDKAFGEMVFLFPKEGTKDKK